MGSRVLAVLRHAWRIFSGRGARFLGAAIAFYSLLSVAPLLVVILHIVASIFGRARAESAVWSGLSTWLAPQGVATARALTEHLEHAESSGGVFESFIVIYGSTRLFRALRRALNQLWGVDLESVEAARGKALKYVVRYGIAFALTLLVVALVAFLIVVKSGFAFLATLGAPGHEFPRVMWAIDGGVSVGAAFALFTALFKFLPETPVSFRQAATSSLVSTILFAAGSGLVTIYIGRKHVSDLYDGAAAVVIAMLWVYYSAQVLFFGACIGVAIHAKDEAESPTLKT